MENHDQVSSPDLGLHNFQKKGIEIRKNYANTAIIEGVDRGLG